MEDMELEQGIKKPKFVTVLIFTAAFAMIFSWLACFAIPNALANSGLMQAVPDGVRGRWMVQAFLVLFGAFAVIGCFLHWMSNRSLRRIDELAQTE